jgi:hypothetical protein
LKEGGEAIVWAMGEPWIVRARTGMDERYPRRFTLLDAVVLLAATAIAFASSRHAASHLWAVLHTIDWGRLNLKDKGFYLETVFFETPSTGRMDTTLGFAMDYAGTAMSGDFGQFPIDSRGQASTVAMDLFTIILALLMLWSNALLILRLCSPWPPHRDLMRQPGVWACGSAVLAMVIVLWLEYLTHLLLSPILISAAVATAWLGLALSRRWRPEVSWIDRAGRAVGVCWLGMFPLYFLWRYGSVGGSRNWIVLLLNRLL